MSAHTPGPWDSDGVAIYQTKIDRPICRVEFHPTIISSLENMSLMAAAPELLDACRGLIRMMDDGLLVRDIRGDMEPGWAIKQLPLVMAVKAATEAIAKATGDE